MDFIQCAISFTSGVIVPLLGILIKNYQDKKKESKVDPIAGKLEFNELVYNRLAVIKEKYDADRVFITQFHNGGHYYPSLNSPLLKFSVFYELVSPGAKVIQQIYRSIPIGLYSPMINEIFKKNVLKLEFSEKPDTQFYRPEDIYESKVRYAFAMKCVEGKYVGILNIDYIDTVKSLDEHQIQDLMVTATALGTTLINQQTKQRRNK